MNRAMSRRRGARALDEVEGPLQPGRPHRLALIEATQGWEVPAGLAQLGAANYDLTGGQHLAVLRRCSRPHGADP